MAIGSYRMKTQALLKGRAVPELATSTQHAGKLRQNDITAVRAKSFHGKK